MKITNLKVVKIKNEENKTLLGIASIELDSCFVVNDLKIIQGNERIFVAMPNRKNSDGKYRDICHPINIEFRKEIENAVLSEYQKIKEA